ncbi:acyl-CoA synthetase (AMP-forming)/AMP-acid ligase II [Advenella incenata]|uniref:Acyl-CoA synthetase (AMP-forming)/AMP-acid ligase II n=1 Tax=Advenella incenata TaxID=267800 RepID=A0A4Q7VFW5_9BURK|nr:AMP-binding protein [Advenella incenata]RZT94881.1 acyl-CoA synthetase (AMP-forming)/AMP-acid ligase II [Advenella incenata]
MNIAILLQTAASSFAHRPAISFGDQLYASYEQFGDRVARIAASIRSAGLVKGDRVGIAMTNAPEYLEILFGIWHAGLCAVPMNAKLHEREVNYALEHSGSRWCFITQDLSVKLASLPEYVPSIERVIVAGSDSYRDLFSSTPMPIAEVEARDPAWLFYTSGTTGRPKGATLTHHSLMAMTLRYFADIDEVTEQDCMLHAAPMSHGGGLYALPHIAKASHHVVPVSTGFDPTEIFELTHLYNNLTFFVVPTMLNRLVNHPAVLQANLNGVKTIFYGGAPMYVEDLKRAIDTFGPKLVGIYAQGETPNTLTFLSKRAHADVGNPRYEEHLSSVGIARTGVNLRVVDDHGKDLPLGEIGEIITRSDVCMDGYWNNPEATEKTLRDGWLFTGDMGCISDDGYLSLKDRSKDLIISGGSNIYPREVEEVLLLHPGVLEVSVVGRPHHDWGEEVVAFIVVRSGYNFSVEELDAICMDNIARYKRPKEYIILSELPKSDYGKVLKSELRKLLKNSNDASEACQVFTVDRDLNAASE